MLGFDQPLILDGIGKNTATYKLCYKKLTERLKCECRDNVNQNSMCYDKSPAVYIANS